MHEEENQDDTTCPRCGIRQYNEICPNCGIKIKEEIKKDKDKDDDQEYDRRERR